MTRQFSVNEIKINHHLLKSQQQKELKWIDFRWSWRAERPSNESIFKIQSIGIVLSFIPTSPERDGCLVTVPSSDSKKSTDSFQSLHSGHVLRWACLVRGAIERLCHWLQFLRAQLSLAPLPSSCAMKSEKSLTSWLIGVWIGKSDSSFLQISQWEKSFVAYFLWLTIAWEEIRLMTENSSQDCIPFQLNPLTTTTPRDRKLLTMDSRNHTTAEDGFTKRRILPGGQDVSLSLSLLIFCVKLDLAKTNWFPNGFLLNWRPSEELMALSQQLKRV